MLWCADLTSFFWLFIIVINHMSRKLHRPYLLKNHLACGSYCVEKCKSLRSLEKICLIRTPAVFLRKPNSKNAFSCFLSPTSRNMFYSFPFHIWPPQPATREQNQSFWRSPIFPDHHPGLSWKQNKIKNMSKSVPIMCHCLMWPFINYRIHILKYVQKKS